jgi:hypothetical protein
VSRGAMFGQQSCVVKGNARYRPVSHQSPKALPFRFECSTWAHSGDNLSMWDWPQATAHEETFERTNAV